MSILLGPLCFLPATFFRWMAVFSVIYICTAIVLYRIGFGDTSLVYANIINLTARIAYALHYISSYFRSRKANDLLRWREAVPKWWFCFLLLVSYFTIYLHERKWGILAITKAGDKSVLLRTDVMTHVGLGGALGLLCLMTWWIFVGRSLVPSHRQKTE